MIQKHKSDEKLYNRANVYCGCYKIKTFVEKMAEKCKLDMEKYAEINELSGRFYIFSVQIDLDGKLTEESVQISPFFYAVLCMIKSEGINVNIMQEDICKLNEDVNELLKQNDIQILEFTDITIVKNIVFDKLGVENESQVGLEGASDKVYACKGLKKEDETSDFFSFYLDEIERVQKNYKNNEHVIKYITSLLYDNQKKIMIDSDVNAMKKWLEVDRFPLAKYPSKFSPTLMQQLAINIAISEKDRYEKIFSVNGPPGTGKTLLARAVAGEAGCPFFSISGSDFVEMFVGVGASRVRDLFEQAKKNAPSIIFIDEIDAVGRHRGAGLGGGHDEREQTLNQLLTEMDGFDAAKGVIILAATNRPESLDPALTRPGRFDRRVPVELPDLKGREEILKVHAKKVKIAPGVDFNTVARMASGASGAELANIVNEAALRAVRAGRKSVTQADLEESIEVVIAGYQKKNSILTDHEKCIVAYHEIGHALVAAKQSNSAPVQKITIIPRTSGALGYTMQVDEGNHYLMNKAELENKIATLTGGRAAEEVAFNSITTGASNDIEQATKLARAMLTRYGMSDEFDMVALETVNNQYLGGDTSLACSAQTQREIDQKVVDLVKTQHEKAIRILTENRAKLDELAQYLYQKETITGEEFMDILNRDDTENKPENP